MIVTAMMVYLVGSGNIEFDVVTGVATVIAFGVDYFLATRLGSHDSGK